MDGLTFYLSAFAVGLLGAVHCVGMCGGIIGALTLSLPPDRPTKRLLFQLAYNAGRITSYSLAGAIMGSIGLLLTEQALVDQIQRALLVVAALFMLLLGLYLSGWWHLLSKVEALGLPLWRRLEPLGRHLLPIATPAQAFGLGLVWGWLPCGLVYSTLLWSISAGGPLQGAALMLSFGLGTLPNLLALGATAQLLQRFTRNPWVKTIAGLLVMSFGIHLLWDAIK